MPQRGGPGVQNPFVLPDCNTCTLCQDGCIGINSVNGEIFVGLEGSKIIRHSGFYRCSLTKSANQLIPKLTWTSVAWNVEEYDTGEMHESVTNPDRVTITRAGNYGVKYQVELETSKDTQISTRIWKNSSTVINGSCMMSPKDGFNMCVNESHDFDLVENDYIVIQVYHDNAADKNLLSARSYMQVRRLF